MAEADLRRIGVERDEARRTLERALDFSGIATWRYDARTGAIHWRGAVAELWGADYATALAHVDGFFDRVHPDDREAVRGVLGDSVASGAQYAAEYRLQHPERGVRWIAVHGDWAIGRASWRERGCQYG